MTYVNTLYTKDGVYIFIKAINGMCTWQDETFLVTFHDMNKELENVKYIYEK